MRQFTACIAVFILSTLVVALADDTKPQNELISDFVDNPAKYKGKTITFQVSYRNRVGTTRLDERVGRKGVPFEAKDPKNNAALLLGLELPAGLKDVPKAKDGEEVVVTFKCDDGETTKGNVAVKIRRP